MASSAKNVDLIESHMSKLCSDVHVDIIKTTLKDIREKIHTSKQFYKEFLIKFHSSDGVSRLLEVIRQKLEEESVIDLAVSVLATCCLDKINAEQVKELRGISVLATVLRRYSKSSVSIVNRCARTLANLAKNIEIDDDVDDDVVPILVQTLDETDDSGCCHSLLRVLKMFSSSKSRTILWNIIDCGGLRIACTKLKSKDSKLVLLAMETLVALTAPFNKHKSRGSLSLPVAAANPVLENDSLANLFDLLSHHKPDIQYHSWECIGNLMSSNIGRAALGNAGFVKFYLATARKEMVKMSVRERCAQYLCLCCQESVNRAKILELDGLRFLVDLLDENPEPLPVVPSALVVAAIAEFRYDAPALELFAKLKLVKYLLMCLERKAKIRSQQLEQKNAKTSSDAEEGSAVETNRKRKRKKRRDRSKRMKMDVDCDDDGDAPVKVCKDYTFLSTTTIPEQRIPDADDGLSPHYQTHWHPESPKMSPSSYGSMPATSPSGQCTSGLSPPRAHFSEGVSPPHGCPPTYQFPSSMMSPPKSDSPSPGSSPSYIYDRSSPQKFFGNTGDVFSPVVSEASESDCSTRDTDDSVESSERNINVEKDEITGEVQSTRHQGGRQTSGTMLEQATRKLSLSKGIEVERSSVSDKNIEVLPQTCTVTPDTEEIKPSSLHNESVKNSTTKREKPVPSSNLQIPSSTTSISPSKSPLPLKHSAQVPSSPRTSFGGDADSKDGEGTPSKDSTRTHKSREEEENIVLILQEMILLRQVQAVLYITTVHAIQTLLFSVTNGGVAQDRFHLLLKDILSSRFFFQKLVSHTIPYLLYKSLSGREKQCEKTTSQAYRQEQKNRRSSRSSSSSEVQGSLDCSKTLEYLFLLQDCAETSFGQKEIEHLLLGNHIESKLGAALSLPYLYSSGPVLKHLLVDCEALQVLLSQYVNQPTSESDSKLTRSLCRASRMLLPRWKPYCDRYFEAERTFSEEVSSGRDLAGSSSESRTDECFYKAQKHLVDLSLVCDGEETVQASRQVLTARSEYFACLLTGSFQEAGQHTIKLEGIRIRSLTCFLHSLYDCHPNHCNTLSSLSEERLDALLDIIATVKFYMTAGGTHRADGSELCLLEQTVTGIILNLKLCDYTVPSLVKFAARHHCHKFLDCCMLFVLRDRTHLRKHVRDLLTSDFGDQINECILELFRNSNVT